MRHYEITLIVHPHQSAQVGTMIDKNKEWQKIGTISLFKSVVSASCDQRLHFHHPKWRDDLNYGD